MQDKKLMFVWVKTLLSIYKYIDTLTSAIDDLVYKKSVNSSFFGGGYYNSAYNCANYIMELIERKKNLLIVKDDIDDAMAKLPNISLRVLVLSYFDCVKSTYVANTLNISIRTLFRKKNLAIEQLCSGLTMLGWNANKFYEHLQSENWLIELVNGNLQSENKNFESSDEQPNNIKEYKLLKCIIKDLNKINKKHYSYL